MYCRKSLINKMIWINWMMLRTEKLFMTCMESLIKIMLIQYKGIQLNIKQVDLFHDKEYLLLIMK